MGLGDFRSKHKKKGYAARCVVCRECHNTRARDRWRQQHGSPETGIRPALVGAVAVLSERALKDGRRHAPRYDVRLTGARVGGA